MKWSRIHLEKCTVEDEQRREERVKTAVRQKQRMFVSKISVDSLIVPLIQFNSGFFHLSQQPCTFPEFCFKLNFKVHLDNFHEKLRLLGACLFIPASNILCFAEKFKDR